MPIRFRNPNFRTPIEAKATQHAPAVAAWLALPAQASNRMITLNELRAGLPVIAADLNRETFNQIASILDLSIEDPSDNQA